MAERNGTGGEAFAQAVLTDDPASYGDWSSGARSGRVGGNIWTSVRCRWPFGSGRR